MPGDNDLPVRTRAALLDALQALEPQLDALIVIGAQALYLHTGDIDLAIPEETKDADIGVDRGDLQESPRLDKALEGAGFHRELERPQPGRWINPDGIPVDLMISEAMAGAPAANRRGARVPPHDQGSMRRAKGLEATIIDSAPITIGALDPGVDERSYEVRVAGPGALLVAKLYKIGERAEEAHARLRNKDAHDVYRLLVATDTTRLAETMSRLQEDPFSANVAEQALRYLADLFAAGADARGSRMAGDAEAGVGEPAVASAAVTALSADLLEALSR